MDESVCPTATVYPKKYTHGFVVLCFVVVMQSFIMNSHEVFIHIHQGCFAGTGAIVRLPQCQWSKPDGYGKISQCITTTKHSKAKTVCIFLGIYCICGMSIYLSVILIFCAKEWYAVCTNKFSGSSAQLDTEIWVFSQIHIQNITSPNWILLAPGIELVVYHANMDGHLHSTEACMF